MPTFNTTALEAIIESYEADLEKIRKDELYKWEALYCFHQHWNPGASDFAAMLEAALSKAGNLLSGQMYYPERMLLQFARNEPARVRKALAALFDEGKPLRQRMEAFEGEAEGMLERRNEKHLEEGSSLAKNHYQDTRSMSVYLAFANPSENYLYKTEMYRKFAERIGVDYPGNKFDKVVAYRELCDEVLSYLEENHAALLDRSDELLPPEYRDADPEHHVLVQDIVFYVDAYMGKGGQPDAQAPSVGDHGQRVWLYAPGEQAWAWQECLDDGIMLIGWEELGDLAQYATKDDITARLQELENTTSSKVNDSLACWQFQNEMAPGDIVFAKRGMYSIIGKGIVRSDARYLPERDHYNHARDVDWIAVGDWDVKGAGIPLGSGDTMKALPMKTLTEWTAYPDAVEAVDQLLADEIYSEPLPAADEIYPEPSPAADVAPEPYTDEDFLSQVFMAPADYDELKALLRRKMNVILQGAPGTGKTFAAKRLAWAMMGCKDSSRVQQVQFHQNSSYDDFVYGYRPNERGGFDKVPGVFTEFCQKAASRPDEDFFFIVDEINRANVSKVFGELLMLVEADHRDDPIVLPVSGQRFCVPSNVYIIGMMNTADRGLALIDYALRRRFAFFEMEPALSNERFLQTAGKHMEPLVAAVASLNEAIAADPALGRGFRIGHSYFCPGKDGPADPASVVKYELAPLVEEYWFDDEKRAHEEIAKLWAAAS